MPYRFHKPKYDDVDYHIPGIEFRHDAQDISDFIARLGEPQRSICHAVVLDGENIGEVAAAHHLSRQRVGKILRSSLLPLAEDFGLVPRHFRK